MADGDKPEIQPNKGVVAVVFVVGAIVFALLFNLYGFLKLPTGTAQEIAAYYGSRLIPVGIALTLLGFAAAIATTAGTAFGKVIGGDIKPTVAGFDLPQVTDLLKAAQACRQLRPASAYW
jgi:hypothetical protein